MANFYCLTIISKQLTLCLLIIDNEILKSLFYAVSLSDIEDKILDSMKIRHDLVN